MVTRARGIQLKLERIITPLIIPERFCLLHWRDRCGYFGASFGSTLHVYSSRHLINRCCLSPEAYNSFIAFCRLWTVHLFGMYCTAINVFGSILPGLLPMAMEYAAAIQHCRYLQLSTISMYFKYFIAFRHANREYFPACVHPPHTQVSSRYCFRPFRLPYPSANFVQACSNLLHKMVVSVSCVLLCRAYSISAVFSLMAV